MAIQTNPQFANLAELYLDPLNPRLGRKYAGAKISQAEILEHMEDWKLEFKNKGQASLKLYIAIIECIVPVGLIQKNID